MVLTLPVFIAVMAMELFDATWVPEVLLEPWVQLAMITPVMVWVGWPIHRTGWLALAHRAADMNSLITLGTLAAYGYSLVATAAPSLLPADARDVYFEAVGVILTLIMLDLHRRAARVLPPRALSPDVTASTSRPNQRPPPTPCWPSDHATPARPPTRTQFVGHDDQQRPRRAAPECPLRRRVGGAGRAPIARSGAISLARAGRWCQRLAPARKVATM